MNDDMSRYPYEHSTFPIAAAAYHARLEQQLARNRDGRTARLIAELGPADRPDPDAQRAIADLNAGIHEGVNHWTEDVWPNMNPYEWVIRGEGV